MSGLDLMSSDVISVLNIFEAKDHKCSKFSSIDHQSSAETFPQQVQPRCVKQLRIVRKSLFIHLVIILVAIPLCLFHTVGKYS